jgi:hypothetical protein
MKSVDESIMEVFASCCGVNLAVPEVQAGQGGRGGGLGVGVGGAGALVFGGSCGAGYWASGIQAK